MNQMLTILAFFVSFYRLKGDAPGSVPQPNIAFAPCHSDCDGKCVDTCPDYCCVKGAMSKTSGQSQPAQVPQLPRVPQVQQPSELQQTSPSCPALCSKVCHPDCPVRCCNASPPSLYVPSPPPVPTYCPQVCYSMCVSSCPADCCTSTQRGVNRGTLSYSVSLPCPTNCYHSCSVNCPLQCCKEAMKRYRPMAQAVMKTLIAGNYLRMPGPRTVPVIDSHPPSLPNIMIRSNLPCPDNCKKVCSLTCSKECCRRHSGMGSIKQPIQNTARQDCKTGVTTVGGNAQGACCKFPFIYKGAVYWRCTAQNEVRRWCSVTKVFELDRRWGYCP
ncbi:uncharacterized protein LOC110067192 isoform X2 [Orbicella faveolata]|nr:uncharacterized protein LOC110067192 isoform X2 [Orbicella faveolata]